MQCQFLPDALEAWQKDDFELIMKHSMGMAQTRPQPVCGAETKMVALPKAMIISSIATFSETWHLRQDLGTWRAERNHSNAVKSAAHNWERILATGNSLEQQQQQQQQQQQEHEECLAFGPGESLARNPTKRKFALSTTPRNTKQRPCGREA